MTDSKLIKRCEGLYLGIDGGGTKTEFVLATSDGRVLYRAVETGCNPNDIGFSSCEALIVSQINKILKEFPSVAGIFCGIAGMATGNYAEMLGSTLRTLYPEIKISVASDALNLFSLYDEAGMVVISGTGSVVFVRSGEGYERIGGWGYLFDSAGSAYDIGRDAIRQALKEEDERSSPSLMSQILYKKMDSASAWAHINTLYAKGKPYIASFAPIVFEAYREGDGNAAQIIDRSASALASLLNSGLRLYGAKPIAVASGGIFEHYTDVILELMSKYTEVELKLCDLPPVFGACRKACTVGGAQMSGDFHENFKKSYGEIKI